jgi:hypothetical protein
LLPLAKADAEQFTMEALAGRMADRLDQPGCHGQLLNGDLAVQRSRCIAAAANFAADAPVAPGEVAAIVGESDEWRVQSGQDRGRANPAKELSMTFLACLGQNRCFSFEQRPTGKEFTPVHFGVCSAVNAAREARQPALLFGDSATFRGGEAVKVNQRKFRITEGVTPLSSVYMRASEAIFKSEKDAGAPYRNFVNKTALYRYVANVTAALDGPRFSFWVEKATSTRLQVCYLFRGKAWGGVWAMFRSEEKHWKIGFGMEYPGSLFSSEEESRVLAGVSAGLSDAEIAASIGSTASFAGWLRKWAGQERLVIGFGDCQEVHFVVDYHCIPFVCAILHEHAIPITIKQALTDVHLRPLFFC